MMADVTWITGRSFWWERNKKVLKKRSKQVKFVVVVVVVVGVGVVVVVVVVINDDDDISLTHKHPQICASRNRPDVTKTEIDLQTFFQIQAIVRELQKLPFDVMTDSFKKWSPIFVKKNSLSHEKFERDKKYLPSSREKNGLDFFSDKYLRLLFFSNRRDSGGKQIKI